MSAGQREAVDNLGRTIGWGLILFGTALGAGILLVLLAMGGHL